VVCRHDDARTDAVVLIAYAVWEFFPLILLLTTVAAGACRTNRPRRRVCDIISNRTIELWYRRPATSIATLHALHPRPLSLAFQLAGPVGTATYQAIPKETLNFGVFGAIDAMEAEGDLDGPPLALGEHNRHENDGMGPLSPVAAGQGMAMPYDYMGQQQPPALPPSAMGAGLMAINSVGGGDGMVCMGRPLGFPVLLY
jgi:hypothetical protein